MVTLYTKARKVNTYTIGLISMHGLLVLSIDLELLKSNQIAVVALAPKIFPLLIGSILTVSLIIKSTT